MSALHAAPIPPMSQLTFPPATALPGIRRGPLVTTVLIVGLIALVESIVLMTVMIIGGMALGAAILNAIATLSSPPVT